MLFEHHLTVQRSTFFKEFRFYTSLYGTDFIQVYMELILYKFIWN